MFVLKRGVLMSLARRLVDVVVILGVAYLSFAMALAGWIAALRRGEGVTLLPARGGRKARFWEEIGLVAAVFSLLVFHRRARLEERVLAERFGEEWRAYAERTRFLVPFVY